MLLQANLTIVVLEKDFIKYIACVLLYVIKPVSVPDWNNCILFLKRWTTLQELAEKGYASVFCTKKGLRLLVEGLKARIGSSPLRKELEVQVNCKYRR